MQGLTQTELARKAKMKGGQQVSNLELGKNVHVKFYQQCAIALGFQDALDMFLSPVDKPMKQLMRLWPLLDPQQKQDLVARAHAWIDGDAV